MSDGRDEDLLFRALHGDLAEEEERVLAERLKVDPALAAAFLRLARDEALLGEEVAQARAREISVRATRKRGRWWKVRPAETHSVGRMILAAAALLVLSFLLVVLRPAGPGPRPEEAAVPPGVEERPSVSETSPAAPVPPPVPRVPSPVAPTPDPQAPVPERTALAEAGPVPSEGLAEKVPPSEALPGPSREGIERPTLPSEAPSILLARLTGPLQLRFSTGERAQANRAGLVLRPGDAVETGASGRAVIRYGSGTVVYCNTMTSVRVEEGGIHLSQGEICCGVERSGNFKVLTPDGVVHVTGTRFLVKRAPLLSGTIVTVAEGSVRVASRSGSDSIPVPEGYRLTVPPRSGRGILERADLASLSMVWVNELRPVWLQENFETYGGPRLDPLYWRDTGPENSPLEDDSLFKVQTYMGTKAFGPVSRGVNIHSHYVGTGSASWSAYRFSGRMVKLAPTAFLGITFFSRLPEGEDRYYRIRHYGGSDWERPFHVAPHPHHSPPPPLRGKTSSGLVPEVGVWYEFQVDVESRPLETAIRARIWKSGTPRPSLWAIDCSDDRPDRLRSGTVGIWSMGGGSLFDNLRVEAIDW